MLPTFNTRQVHGFRRNHLLVILAGIAFTALVLVKVPLLPQETYLPSWVVPPSHFVPLHPAEAARIQESKEPLLPPSDIFPAPLKPAEGARVPKALHYVFGLKPVKPGHKPDELPYYAYLAMRSAMINIKPEKTYFYYQNLPTGPWWDLLEPDLILIKAPAVDEVYGHKVSKFAHKADIIRLWAIQRAGGIYLDIDMFIVRSFDDLLAAPTTMGMEASPDSRRTALDPTGLCNAVIIAEPKAPFIDHWMRTYVTFDEDDWAGHSVEMPWKLARLYPRDIQVLNTTAFFWPHWNGENVRDLHERNDYDFIASGQYAYHAWESLAMQWLEKLSPSSIRATDTSFHRLVRPFIGPNDDAVYRKWKGE